MTNNESFTHFIPIDAYLGIFEQYKPFRYFCFLHYNCYMWKDDRISLGKWTKQQIRFSNFNNVDLLYQKLSDVILREMGFQLSRMDPDIWMRRSGDLYEYCCGYAQHQSCPWGYGR